MAGGEDLGRETRCFPGVKYGLGYKTTPDNFTLTDGDSLRSDLVVSLDVISGNELVELVEVNSYSNPFIKFNSDVEGDVVVQLSVKDASSDDVVKSNELTLSVLPYHGKKADDNYWAPKTPTVDTTPVILREGEEFDCMSRITLPKYTYQGHLLSHRGESRYVLASPSTYYERLSDGTLSRNPVNSSRYFYSKPDRMTMVVKKAGEGKISFTWLTRYSSGEIKTSNSASYSADIPVTVIDRAEALGDTMNLRAKVGEVEIDRSTSIYSTLDDKTNIYGGSWAWANMFAYLNSTYSFRPVKPEDFFEYDDPEGIIDLSRLSIKFESDGDNPPVYSWEANGSSYLVAEYGTLDSTKTKTRVRIHFKTKTSNPKYIPIRDADASFVTVHADELDFSEWRPASDLIKITPSDAFLEQSDFSLLYTNSINDFIYFEKRGTSGTISDYVARIAGIGDRNLTAFMHYETPTVYCGLGAIFTVGLPAWDGYRYRAACVPNSRTFVPSKSVIKKGEYVFVDLQNTPDEEFSLDSTAIIYNYIRYSVNSGDPVNAVGLENTGVAEVICATRRGAILKGKAAGTVKVMFGGLADGKNNQAETTITVQDSQYTAPSGTLSIVAQKNSDGTVKSGQNLSLSGGGIAGWNTENPGVALVNRDGYLQTFTSGSVTIYAVTTDGRLVSETFRAQASSSGSPVTPEPEPEIDTTLREAQDTSDSVILTFENHLPVMFESPDSDPVSINIVKGSHNFDLRNVACISENPGVATINGYYDNGTGNMTAEITPKGKGSTIVRVVCGGAEDFLEVSVNDGNVATTPKLEYNGQYGASLNIYEYTEIEFKVDSKETYNNLEFSVTNGRESEIEIMGGGYTASTGLARIKVALKAHASGYVYVSYGTERLVFSIANRFNLRFEDINNFTLGVGATRYIKIFPLDDTIKVSSVRVYSQNGTVEVSQPIEETDKDTGKRYFLVGITYRKSGQDILIAHRKGDDDIYLDFNCETKSIPASSISFNTNSTIIIK